MNTPDLIPAIAKAQKEQGFTNLQMALATGMTEQNWRLLTKGKRKSPKFEHIYTAVVLLGLQDRLCEELQKTKKLPASKV